jgi:DNA-binding NtrC family response regulator
MADILGVDDDPSIAIGRALSDVSKAISTASPAMRRCGALIGERQPTLILMDIRMMASTASRRCEDIAAAFPRA